MKTKKLLHACLMAMVFMSISACPSLLSAGKNKLSVGVNAGASSLVEPSWLADFELGYRLFKHLGLSANLSYSSLSLASTTGTTTETEKTSVLPISLSAVYVTPVSEKVNLYFGPGIGYYPFTAKTTNELSATEENWHAYAPHLLMGTEIKLSKKISLKGDLKYAFGSVTRTSTRMNNGINPAPTDPTNGTGDDPIIPPTTFASTDYSSAFGGLTMTMGVHFYLF